MVLGDIAHNNGLGLSLLQRLYYQYHGHFFEESKESTVLLKINHRSHCDLLALLSKLFYNSELHPSDSVVPLHSTESYPLKFICSSVSNTVDDREPTCEDEMSTILYQVTKLKLKDYSSACVMTTNQKQVTSICLH